MGRIEILIQALESGNFQTVLYQMISESEPAQLEKLALDLSDRVATIEDAVKRDLGLMGVQSIRAALRLRPYFPNGKNPHP